MTIINGVDYEHLLTVDWEDPDLQDGLDGYKIFNRFKRLILKGRVMPVSEFKELFKLEGQMVVVTTTDYDDRNNLRTYNRVTIEDVSNVHIAVNMETVQVDCIVLI